MKVLNNNIDFILVKKDDNKVLDLINKGILKPQSQTICYHLLKDRFCFSGAELCKRCNKRIF